MEGVFVHESSYIDEGAVIGDGTKIWHFCHVQSGAEMAAIAAWARTSTWVPT